MPLFQPSAVTTIGTIDSVTKSANAAVISNANLVLQTADGSNPGVVSTASQTFAGAKTYSTSVITNTISSTLNNTLDIGTNGAGGGLQFSTNGTARWGIGSSSLGPQASNTYDLGGSGSLVKKLYTTDALINSLTASRPVKSDGSKNLVTGTIDVSSANEVIGSFTSFSGSVTLTPSAGSVAASTITIARYMKVGNIVFIRIFLTWQQSDAGCASITINGLPFTAASTNQITRCRINLSGTAGTGDATVNSSATTLNVQPLGANWPLTASQTNLIAVNLWYESA